MDRIKVIGLILIVAGVLGLVYGGFSYTSESHDANVGPFEFTFTDRERVNIPAWAGVGAIALGGFILLFGVKKR